MWDSHSANACADLTLGPMSSLPHADQTLLHNIGLIFVLQS